MHKLLKYLLLPLLLFPLAFSTNVTIKLGKPTGIKEATIVDRILCVLGLQKCIEAYVIESHITKVSNNKAVAVPTKIETKYYVLTSTVQSGVYLDILRSDYPPTYKSDIGDYVAVVPANPIEGKNDQYYIEIDAQNTGSTVKLAKIYLIFGYYKSSNEHYNLYTIEVTIDPPITWEGGKYIFHKVYLTKSQLGKIAEEVWRYTKSVFGTSYKYGAINEIVFISDSSTIIGACEADPNNGHDYQCDDSEAVRTVKIYGRTYYAYETLWGLGTSNYEYGSSVIGTDDKIGSADICANNEFAYDAQGNRVYTCYTCPPNSHNPGTAFSGDQIPYCVCNSGYINKDHPVNGDTSKTPYNDPNGCETRVYNCPAQITISPSSQTIYEGESATYTVYIKNTGSDTCTYSLSTSCPSQVSCSLSKTSITVSPGSTSSVSLTASSNTAGTYTLTVKATDPNGNEYTGSATLIVKEQLRCTVDVSISPTSNTIKPGQTATYTVTIKNNGNTQCTYSLSYDCPSGVSCSLSKNTVTLNAGSSTSVTLTASSNNPGTYTLTVTASSTSPVTGYSDSASATLVVQKYACNVDVQISPRSQTVAPGETATYTVTIKNNGETTCTYSLSYDCPAGVSCSLSQTQVSIPKGGSTTVTLTAKSDNPGTYSITVKAESISPSTGYSDSDTVTLEVQQYSCNVELSVDSTTKTISPGERAQYSITIKNIGNTLCTYTLTASCPTGVSCTLSTNSVSLNKGETATVYLYATSDTPGTYTLTVTATAAQYGGSDSVQLTLKVIAEANPPDVTISPKSATVNVSQTFKFTVYVKNTGYETTTYTLTAQCPTEVTCQLSKTSVTVSPGYQVQVELYATPQKAGTYLITVKAIGPKGEEDSDSAYLYAIQQQQQQQNQTNQTTGGGGGGGGEEVTYGIPSITVSKTLVILQEGYTETVDVIIKNQGPAADTFTIKVDCPTGIDCYITPSSVTLAAGQEATAVLTIVGKEAGNYTAIITVTDGSTATAQIKVEVERAQQSPIPIPPEYYPYVIAIGALLIIAMIASAIRGTRPVYVVSYTGEEQAS